MIATTLIDGLTPPVGSDVALTVSLLRRRFPSAVIWFGTSTHHWWAMVRTGGWWRLIEAAGPEELTRAIINVRP